MQNSAMAHLWSTSHISGGNAAYVEELYETFLVDPNAVPEEWRTYFEKLPNIDGHTFTDVPHSTVRAHFEQLAKSRPAVHTPVITGAASEHERKQVRVLQLISAYRQRGHQKAKLDPLDLWQREPIPDLDMHFHQLSAADYDTSFQTGKLYIGKEEASLKEIIDALEKTYCASVGAEFMHIVDTQERVWIQQRMESVRSLPAYGDDIKLHLLERLTAAEGMEKFLGSKYPGTKRFGLEGAESLIPMMDELIQRCGTYEAKEIVIGMAHRGRLNVLVNTLGKNPADLFDEFEGKAQYDSSGDVKYHSGYSSNVHTPGGEVHLALAFNPSHLEIVAPVVEGSVRARQDRRNDYERNGVVPIVVHGDAAFAGQGVVMETFQMSQTRAYKTGGTVHIVINNQVGFTTNKQEDARSTEYCTDIAKMVQAPIFHVNGDDPEAVLFVTQMALDFRQQFKKDVVIDLLCYRRRGHNEADEPAITQPLMYEVIRKLPTTRTLYADKLVQEGLLDAQACHQMAEDYRDSLLSGRHVVKSLATEPNASLFVDWSNYSGDDWSGKYKNKINIKTLQKLASKMAEVPEGFAVQRQVNKIYEDRKSMAAGAMPVNWGFAENLAYATILDAGNPVRITGQDVGRGTFSHRHAVIHNQKENASYVSLQHLSDEQPLFTIHDSLLSEVAVLGFEYGYATTTPEALVIWEAQFGDFANGAQVVIDQFISSGEQKWGRLCGLTMLLPHGYEGQGPEHSSARLERYLQLCAENNMQVCVPTTPAQIYHLLRRQVLRSLRKPLIVMSPKSLLRHKEAISSLEELADGSFQVVLPEANEEIKANKVKRIVLCSGKVYYDLRAKRDSEELDDIALIRIEQLYPFPEKELLEIMAPYKQLKEVFWCQEEPMNQGAWFSSQHHMWRVIHQHNPKLMLSYAGREPSAAAAAGYMALHIQQQEAFINAALNLPRKA